MVTRKDFDEGTRIEIDETDFYLGSRKPLLRFAGGGSGSLPLLLMTDRISRDELLHRYGWTDTAIRRFLMPAVKSSATGMTPGATPQGSVKRAVREAKSFELAKVIKAEESRDWPHWIDEWRVVKGAAIIRRS